ncbi:hypothetical protein HNP32_001994 [Brevundimonas bullata]|uniref:Uncharacterized protein n=1 Tax=Brevundimonas bullata TaxID=13160 RepID=A0A7W7IPT0_9CAUL|nr:hypothetical protein [Brevundimonas bullata]MBB4798250.1 hypothetical protein [Brevundimonas bullata]MBB6383436.1 hypothetical protein [Brevundimonas bullata]
MATTAARLRSRDDVGEGRFAILPPHSRIIPRSLTFQQATVHLFYRQRIAGCAGLSLFTFHEG